MSDGMNWTRQRASDQRLSALATSGVVLQLPAAEVVARPPLDLTTGEPASSHACCGSTRRLLARRHIDWKSLHCGGVVVTVGDACANDLVYIASVCVVSRGIESRLDFRS
jgi:hypothetical protein